MKFSLFMKSVGFSVLQNSGVQVTPEQMGIKVKNPTGLSGFAGILNGNNSGVPEVPQAPTAEEIASDPQAQARYNEALQAYNQQFQQFYQRAWWNMMRQFQQMQFNQSASASRPVSPAVGGNVGVGGILGSLGDEDS